MNDDLDPPATLRGRALDTMTALEASELERELQASAADGDDAVAGRSGWVERAVGLLLGALGDADAEAAQRRVQKLRRQHPDADVDALVERVVQRTVRTTAAIGAATSSAALVPAIGTLTALTVGVATDLTATFKAQAEMVLEIAALYDHPLGSVGSAQIVFVVTGVSSGGNLLLDHAGRGLGAVAGGQLARRWLAKALPVIGVIASGGTNALSSYVIGRRAQAYFRDGPEAVADWRDSVRRLSGVDERSIGGALTAGGQRTLDAVRDAAGAVAQGALAAGTATRDGVADAFDGLARGSRGLAARLPAFGRQGDADAGEAPADEGADESGEKSGEGRSEQAAAGAAENDPGEGDADVR